MSAHPEQDDAARAALPLHGYWLSRADEVYRVLCAAENDDRKFALLQNEVHSAFHAGRALMEGERNRCDLLEAAKVGRLQRANEDLRKMHGALVEALKRIKAQARRDQFDLAADWVIRECDEALGASRG